MFKRTEKVLAAVLFGFTFGLILQTATAWKHQKYSMNYMKENQDYESTDKLYHSSRALYYLDSASGKIESNYK